MYVKDLEMKSGYLEGKCRRLSCLLQWSIAENQALRFTLNQCCAFDASLAKQESAVLLLGTIRFHKLLIHCVVLFLYYNQKKLVFCYRLSECYRLLVLLV